MRLRLAFNIYRYRIMLMPRLKMGRSVTRERELLMIRVPGLHLIISDTRYPEPHRMLGREVDFVVTQAPRRVWMSWRWQGLRRFIGTLRHFWIGPFGALWRRA